MEPAFYHTSAADIPQGEKEGITYRVMMGEAYGLTSPVKTFSPILYVEIDMVEGTEMELPQAEERGVYVVKGEAEIDGEDSLLFSMSILSPDAKMIRAKTDTRLAIIGGSPLGKRFMEWNFVSSRPERIKQAVEDWREGRFDKVPGDDDEFIPYT